MKPASHPIAAQVRRMFDGIAHRYDLANSVLSLGLHHRWKNYLVARLAATAPAAPVLDLCCGSGDLLCILKRQQPRATPVGADFSAEMLKIARRRIGSGVQLVESDALRLPFTDNSFGAVAVAFGVRNFENLEGGLDEAARVLKPGGHIFILEFGQPAGWWGFIFGLYSRLLLPALGGIITGNKPAYRYLQETSALFPCGPHFEAIMKSCGFSVLTTRSLAGGVAYLYCGIKRD